MTELLSDFLAILVILTPIALVCAYFYSAGWSSGFDDGRAAHEDEWDFMPWLK